MKVLSVLSSPKKHGNTAILLNEYLNGVKRSDAHAQIETVYLHSKNIQYCTGCDSCRKSSRSQCVLKDDMQSIYQSVRAADALILATPVYAYNMTAQLKTFFDRLHAVASKDLKDKKIVLLTTYGDSVEAASGTQNIVQSITMYSQYVKMNFIQNLNISTYDIPISKNDQAKKSAYILGTNLINY